VAVDVVVVVSSGSDGRCPQPAIDAAPTTLPRRSRRRREIDEPESSVTGRQSEVRDFVMSPLAGSVRRSFVTIVDGDSDGGEPFLATSLGLWPSTRPDRLAVARS